MIKELLKNSLTHIAENYSHVSSKSVLRSEVGKVKFLKTAMKESAGSARDFCSLSY